MSVEENAIIYTVELDDDVVNQDIKSNKKCTCSIDNIKNIITRVQKSKYAHVCAIIGSAMAGIVVYIGINYAGEPPFSSVCIL